MAAKGNNLVRLSFTGTYEHTRYGETKFEYLTDTLSNSLKVWRMTGRIFGRHRWVEDRLNVLFEFWWQQSVTSKNNYRFYNDCTLELPLKKHFSFRSGFRYTYENVNQRIKTLRPILDVWPNSKQLILFLG